MTLKEYRKRNGMTIREVVEELKQIDSRFTASTVSYMENGVVDTPESVNLYIAREQIKENTTPLTEVEDTILRCLVGRTKEDPLTRDDLRHWCGFNDRAAREAIEGLRSRGYWIINGINGGYYITFNRAEMEEWLMTYTARARTINKVATAMRAADPEQIAI